jgi:predicted nuclease of predicted toxin-antitoxin system
VSTRGSSITYAASVMMSSICPKSNLAQVMTVMMRADDEQRLLLTEDKDFGDLVFRQAGRVPGIVLLRIDPMRRELKRLRLQGAVDKFGTELFGRYTVIEAARFRSRPLRPGRS